MHQDGNMEFALVGVVGDIQNTDLSNTVVLKLGTRDECVNFFKAMTADEKEAFVEIFVMEKEKFVALADKPV
jgi:hypothetical protein